ncbi:hypothetical protein FDI59_gp095 [Mycobacterium phage Yoshi]|uniref:Uncharacterized protein n=1 Tax=Mycobacterium phage Yoshi TaxID=2920891 RepID=G1BSK2_9CAUD|nr:hypothetical protein FDI59_gp095 [Mycobacterium phage Yoshi]AEK07843.1 hypothetical protein YOSHI_95 [Mycobacterium phage Yoshi]
MADEIECRWCREVIRPNQTGGWYHVATRSHASDQRCFMYATPAERGGDK